MAADVRHNPDLSRYELFLGGLLVGVADYHIEGDAVVFPHTEIVPHLRGQGLGEQLVRGALDDVMPTGRRVIPQCWFVAEFIDLHPEFQE